MNDATYVCPIPDVFDHTCTACRLHKHVTTICVSGRGPRDASIILVGEAPGKTEDRLGAPFIGAAGKQLSSILDELQMASLCYITNVVKCRPPLNGEPRAEEMTICADLYLYREIAAIRPKVIVTLGLIASSEFPSVRGRFGQVDIRGLNVTIIPTIHPSFVKRQLVQANDDRPLRRLRDDLALAKGFAT